MNEPEIFQSDNTGISFNTEFADPAGVGVPMLNSDTPPDPPVGFWFRKSDKTLFFWDAFGPVWVEV